MITSNALQLSQLKNPAVSLTEWDDFVASVKNGHVFQTMPWAVYRQKVGWNPLLLSLANHGSLRAGSLVLQRSIAGLPIGGVLFVPRGPVLDYSSPEAPDLLSGVLDKLTQLARRRYAVVRVCPDVERTTTWVEEMLLEKGFRRAKRSVGHTATIRLDLTQPLDRIIAGMNKDRRRDVRRLNKAGNTWSCYQDDSLDSLELLYSMYRSTIERAGKSPKSYHNLCLMHETLSAYGSSFILVIQYEGRPVSAVMLVPMKKHFWGFGASMNEEGRELKLATVALYWEIIKWARKKGYTEFDLQGIPDPLDPDDPLYGVYQFKRRWGGEEVHLMGEYDYTLFPLLTKLLEWKLAH